jgi:hypothetical protein
MMATRSPAGDGRAGAVEEDASVRLRDLDAVETQESGG